MKTVHNSCHFLHTGSALAGEACNGVDIVAVLFVHSFSCFKQAYADGTVVCSHLADEHRTDNSVLIPYIRAAEVAVALLKAEDKSVSLSGSFEISYLLADKLEAGEDVAHLNAVILGDFVGNGSGDYRLYGYGVLGHLAQRDSFLADVFKQHCTYFVSAEQNIVAVLARNRYADSVAVGVGS